MNRSSVPINLIVLLIVCGLLVIGVLWVNQANETAQNATPTPMPTQVVVWALGETAQVTQFRLSETATGQGVTLAQDPLVGWKITEPETAVADQAAVGQAAATLAKLAVSRVITAGAELSAYGLLTSTYTLEASLTDGTQLKVSIGDKILDGSGYYVLRPGETTPLVIKDPVISTLIGWLTKLPYQPTPTPTLPPTPTLAMPLETAPGPAPATAAP